MENEWSEADYESSCYEESEGFDLQDWLANKNNNRLHHQKRKGKSYYIECDSKYNKGQKLYYQQGYGFSIFFDNRTLFKKETAENILLKFKFNNPKIIKE